MENIRLIDEREIFDVTFRIFGTIEEPLFLAKDVAQWINYSKSNGKYKVSQMLSTVDDDEKLVSTLKTPDMKQARDMWFLTEDGLYEVLMQSRMEVAKLFKKQVKAILKEIRKTGSHIKDDKQSEVNAIEKVITKVQDVDVLNLIGSMAEQQKQLIHENTNLQKQIEENKPKLEFVSNVEEATGTFSVGRMAEIMSKNGVMVGRNRMFNWLRESGFLCKQQGVEYNRPKQRMIEQGYMEVSVHVDVQNGRKTIHNTPLVTGKGLVFFFNKYREYLEYKEYMRLFR